METVKQPYEFLVRWNTDGGMAAAHVVWRYVTRDGGGIVAESVSSAEAVALGDSKGFPLADILSEAHTSALKRCEEYEAMLKQREREIEDASAKLEEAKAA